LEVEHVTIVKLRLRNGESSVIKQRNGKRKSKRLVMFELGPVYAIKAGKVAVVASVGAGRIMVLVVDYGFGAVLAVVDILARLVIIFLVLLYTVVAVIDTILTVHRTGRTVKWFIVIADRLLRREDRVRSIVVGRAAVESARRSGRHFLLAAAGELDMRLRKESRRTL
jgi:hypothetical protein